MISYLTTAGLFDRILVVMKEFMQISKLFNVLIIRN